MAEELKKGDPTALGIFAYGFGLMILSIYAVGGFSWGEHLAMAAPALAFSGIFLLIASIWEYNNGNTFGATAFGTYSAFFLTFGFMTIFLWMFPSSVTDAMHAHLVGMMALAFVFMTFFYWIASFKMTVAHNLMLFFLLLVFIMWAIPLLSFNGTTGNTIFGTSLASSVVYAGYLGLIDVIFTSWLAAAVIINDRWKVAGFKPPIPLFPIGQKKTA